MKKYLFPLLFVFSLILAYFIVPKEYNDFLKLIYLLIIPIVESLFIFFIIIKIKKVIKNYKSINKNMELDVIQKLRIALSPIITKETLLEILLLDFGVIYYSIIIWFKKTEVIKRNGYTYHKTLESKSMFIAIIIFALFDTAVIHFLIQKWSITVAWIITFLTIYSFLILIASYNSMRFLPHELKQEYLIIRNGLMASVQVQLDNIDSIKKAKERGLGEKIPKDEYNFVPSLESPHYELIFKNPVNMKGLYGIKKPISKIIFRVDQQKEFLDELNKKISCSN